MRSLAILRDPRRSRNHILEVARALYCLMTTYLTRSKIYFSGAESNFALHEKAFVRKFEILKALLIVAFQLGYPFYYAMIEIYVARKYW